jgi:hypothetical protein
MPQDSPPAGRWLVAVLASVWLACCATGLYVVWAWDNTPGEKAQAQAGWPADSTLTRDPNGPTLVMLVHPQCTCSRASLTELAELLARSRPRPKTFLLFLKPEGVADGWEQTDLWKTATGLPGVTVIRDHKGEVAARFGAFTSGQTFLYDARGGLQFSGGITGARAHAGDNAGRRSLVALLNASGAPAVSRTNVFGCPLFDRTKAGASR